MEITSIESLRQMAEGEVVELPSFYDGKPFIAKIKRPSLISLAARGLIPNPLLGAAEEIFNGQIVKAKATNHLYDTAKVLEIIAENSLVDPTYKQIRESGVDLTDMQFLAIYNYSQLGVKALESFRTVKSDNKCD